MDMQLVPVYADEGSDAGKVTISPRVQQSLGVRLAEVSKGALTPKVEAVGSVAYNERAAIVVQARSNGYVEKLHVRAPLDPVRKGQPLAELYVPDWVAAQEEYLSVKRMSGAGLEALLDGAYQRMRLAGMNDDQIRLVESSGKVHARLTVTAPAGGVVAELGAREGMTVASGALLFRINGLDPVWVNAEVPENQISLVRPGNAVEARAPALPGTVFKGRVSTLLPEVNPATRTLKARVELANPGNRLVPGMFATVNFTPTMRQEALVVPTEAVIHTGKRSVVIVAQDDGRFAPVDVETGIEADGRTEIRKGLEAGQKIVLSGQFLIDSEASLKAATTRMGDAPIRKTAQEGRATHHGKGKLTGIDPASGRVELEHGPIPSLKWPAMKMEFPVADKGQLARAKKGDVVEFELRGEPDKDGEYVIENMTPSPAPPQGGTTDGAGGRP
jgi:Cu(I)/Ag(I) efflux system membrane fusion protein